MSLDGATREEAVLAHVKVEALQAPIPAQKKKKKIK
jgi:hypothetical protein